MVQRAKPLLVTIIADCVIAPPLVTFYANIVLRGNLQHIAVVILLGLKKYETMKRSIARIAVHLEGEVFEVFLLRTTKAIAAITTATGIMIMPKSCKLNPSEADAVHIFVSIALKLIV